MAGLRRFFAAALLALAGASAASAQARFSLFNRAYAPGTVGTMYYTSATAGDISPVAPGTANECLQFASAPGWGSCLTAVSGSTIALSPGSNNNLDIGERSLVNLTCTVGPACNLTGIVGGTDGRVILVNGTASGGSYIGLQNESASSTAANRIVTATGSDIASQTLNKKTTAVLVYDGASSRWAVIEDERVTYLVGQSKYTVIQDEGSNLTQRGTLNFAGAGVTCADGASKTTCTIPAGLATALTITKDEGSTLATDDTTLDFVGAGVTATTSGVTTTVTIPNAYGSGATFPDVQTFTANGTWNKPTGVTVVQVTCTGGGGGGGGGTASYASSRIGGSGGGGGARIERVFPASGLASTVAVTIGAGGAGGAGRTSPGVTVATAGGASSFGTYLYAYGGGAGCSQPDNTNARSGGGGGGAYGPGANCDGINSTLGGLPAKSGETSSSAVGTAGASSYIIDTNGTRPQAAEWGGGAGGGAKMSTATAGTRAGGRSMYGAGGGGGGMSLDGNFNNRTLGEPGGDGGASGAYTTTGGGGGAGATVENTAGTAGGAGGVSYAGQGGGGGAAKGVGVAEGTGHTGAVGGAGGIPGGGGGGGGAGYRNDVDNAGQGGAGGAGARGECVVISW